MTILNEGARSVTTLMDYDGVLAVKKVFRPGCERFNEREVFARKRLSPRFPEIPPLLDHGELYVVSPFYTDSLCFDRSELRLFPVSIAVQVLRFLERLYHAGFALLDAHPENLLVTEKGNVMFFDFEFLHVYGNSRPASFCRSWDLLGPPPDWDGDQPRGGCPTWESHWAPYVGLSMADITQASSKRQQWLRLLHWATYVLPRKVDRYLPPAGRRIKHRLARIVRSRREHDG